MQILQRTTGGDCGQTCSTKDRPEDTDRTNPQRKYTLIHTGAVTDNTEAALIVSGLRIEHQMDSAAQHKGPFTTNAACAALTAN